MGQIFTWDAILSNSVPSLEHFTQVADLLRTELDRSRLFAGALMCGSVVRGDHTIRSDFDCVVLYHPREAEEVRTLLRSLIRRARNLHVPLSFIVCDTEIAKTRMHHLGPAFREHLRASAEAGGVIGTDPLGYFAKSVETKDEIESYIRVKLYGLESHFSEYALSPEHEQVRFLAKAYESAMHVARKVLQLHGMPLPDDSKAAITRAYKTTQLSFLGELLSEIVSLDRQYTEFLETILRIKDEERYRELLEWMGEGVPKIIDFIKKNILNYPLAMPA